MSVQRSAVSHLCNMYSRFISQVGSNKQELHVWEDGGMSHCQHILINKRTAAFMHKSQNC